jgi:hypothetical protein
MDRLKERLEIARSVDDRELPPIDLDVAWRSQVRTLQR